MVGKKVVCILFSIVFAISAGFLIKEGFDKTISYKSANQYVGGDAYNYIISGTYFTGYLVIGSASMICSSMFLIGALLISSSNNQHTSKNDNPYTLNDEENAENGKLWFCKTCKKLNQPDAPICVHCSAERSDSDTKQIF